MQKISFVIPCYGSQNTIQSVVGQINTLMDEHVDYKYEIILVNDKSPDNVWKIIEELHYMQPNIVAVNFSKNFGQHSALMAGYRECTGDYVVTLDDDGQTPAGETFILLDKLDEGYDVVYGKYAERKDNCFRKFGTYINNCMLEGIVGKPKDVHLTSFFVAKKFIIEEICKYENPYPYIWGLILRATSNITNVMIQHEERKDGQSGYTIRKLLHLWLNGLTAFSVKPLRVATLSGLIVSIIGFLFTIYTIVNKLVHPTLVAGYSSLMCAILIIGGVIMILLGMVGEYVGRIYICINNAPQYVIKEVLRRK